jgi:hypothetical protein
MMRTQPNLHLLGVLLTLWLFLCCSTPMQAQRADSRTDDQARQAAERAVRKAGSGSNSGPLKTSRREDLEEVLLTIEEKKPAREVYFYEMQSPPRTAFAGSSVWVVAVARSTLEVYQLYGFEASGGLNGSSQEFDRLISQLALSIPNEKATSLARFFLGCCIGGELSEIVLDEEGLRHALQRYYFKTYGDVWRALETYSHWWRSFQANAPDLAPKIRFENGRYRVVLKRILMGVGAHPQLQEWDLEISRGGNVRVLAMQPIFPKQTRWLFYDSKFTINQPLP